jgi:hypothetical protein
VICWYCHWGWPRPVYDIYRRALANLDAIPGWDGEYALTSGPAHVVWADENWDSAEWCLAECDKTGAHWDHFPPAVLEIIRQSLRELRALPEDQREVEPEDYDGEHPERYPPPAGVEMVKGIQ